MRGLWLGNLQPVLENMFVEYMIIQHEVICKLIESHQKFGNFRNR